MASPKSDTPPYTPEKADKSLNPGKSPDPDRAGRLAAALRENLRKRKAQSVQRQKSDNKA